MTGSAPAIGVFIALHLSEQARQQLVETIRNLVTAMPTGIRWVDPAGVHLTLKFLGDIDPGRVDNVLEAMGRAARGSSPFRVHLAGLGMFPNQREPRVLWAGIGGDLDALAALQEKLEAAMSSLDFPPDRRPFSPHLTLGRVRDGLNGAARRRIGAVVSGASIEAADSWIIDRVHLMRSTLTPDGAVYASLGSVDLVA